MDVKIKRVMLVLVDLLNFLLFPLAVLALVATVALAEPVSENVENEKSLTVEVNQTETVTAIKDVEDEVQKDTKAVEEVNKTLAEISSKSDTLEDLNNGIKDVHSDLDGIESKIDQLVLEQSEPAPDPVKKVTAAKGNVSFSVYANASPSSQFATYAKQIIPKMGWNDDYVFMQDTSSSYVLVYGDLDLYSAGTVTGNGCDYIRWYYSGTGSGYLVQSGNADVDVSLNGHVILSSLGEYPLLDDGFTLYRQEMCFYALVAVVLFCLSNIWGFTLRSRG